MSDQFEQKPPIAFKEIEKTIPEKEPHEKIWGGATNPEKHNPQNFRYLVYAFNPFANSSQGLIAAAGMLSEAYKSDKSEGDQSINLFEQPEKLEEKVSLSMSLIDQDHTATWGNGGIIVDAPKENILITSPTDSGSHNSNKEFLRKQAQDHLLLSGDKLLKISNSESFNEVVALAKSDTGGAVRLKGFFIKADKRGQPTDPVIAEKMKQHARRLNLPLVEIQVQGPYEQEMLDIAESSVWAHYKGNRYNLGSDNPKFAFFACDDKVCTFFPSPQEIEEVVTHFVERGNLDQAQAQQIRERYKIADTRRKSPKVEYDPKTQEISKVTIKEGYGKEETEYWLGSSGYCWRVNMEGFKKAFEESMLNPTRPRRDAYEYFRYQTPISGAEVLSLLESRKGTMDLKEYKKLFNFFSGIKEKIDKICQQEFSFMIRGNRH